MVMLGVDDDAQRRLFSSVLLRIFFLVRALYSKMVSLDITLP